MGRSETDNFPRETILASFQFKDFEESTWKTSAKYESQQRPYQEVQEQQTRNFLRTNPAFFLVISNIMTRHLTIKCYFFVVHCNYKMKDK